MADKSPLCLSWCPYCAIDYRIESAKKIIDQVGCIHWTMHFAEKEDKVDS